MSSLMSFVLIILSAFFGEDNIDQKQLTEPLQKYNHLCGVSLEWPNGNDRIVGGRIALDGEFPWQVSIRRQSPIRGDFVHICGGSIISDQWVLTAAHCVKGVYESNFLVVANASKLSDSIERNLSHRISKIIVHPNYDEETNANDISLIKLETKLDLGKSYGHMVPVCLPKPFNGQGQFNNKDSINFVTVSGWGSTDEDGSNSINLLATEVAMVEMESCNSTYRGNIPKGFICAGLFEGGKDSCQGDSGGPMIYRDSNNRAHQIGIVSWGEGCGRKGIPGVYVDVNYYVDWINTVVKSKA
uniref:Peptidase S1 domain-containing protein n=1 Tax=Tetranychus urticae TaxID=32264 RepID=T1KRU4_TETUR